MSEVKVSNFDASDYLDSEEAITEYLNAAIDDGDPEILKAAISDVGKARGLTNDGLDVIASKRPAHEGPTGPAN
jgi:probable addiction module antidote protein